MRPTRRSAARRRNLVTGGIALLVMAAVAAAIVFQGGGGIDDIGGTVAEAGCDDIETFDAAEAEDARSHVEDGTRRQLRDRAADLRTPLRHDRSSRTSSTKSVPSGAYVHNLEHGQIVIHYSPDISDETKDTLEDLVEQEAAGDLGCPDGGPRQADRASRHGVRCSLRRTSRRGWPTPSGNGSRVEGPSTSAFLRSQGSRSQLRPLCRDPSRTMGLTPR